MNAATDPRIFAVPELCFATVPSGVRIPYVATGSGEPLLFVHGSLCDYRYWNSQTDALSQHFSCFSVSLSHYWPGDEAGALGAFSWQLHVAELADFIRAMNLGAVHLVGHSRGACVAFNLARSYPELVKTLTLADPAGPLQAGPTPPAPLSSSDEAVRARVAELIGTGELDAGLELFVDSVSIPGIWRKSPASFRSMAIANAATLPKQFRDPLPAYTRAGAAELRCRTLLLAGERSPRMYRDNVDHLAGWMAHVDKRSMAGASHGMNVTHAAAFNRLLHAFLGKQAA
ncbi:alpha/beta fold hydrolase [Massilia sp. LC238]|uniref:alpha/beta fold hydrolase n=1 Tax=Massilia sp. LC238 TaxID=1502852 RepID=UPI0004E41E44|nr:alpha/beta hydrolase [Massilia sp. LC238]KFC74962.1 Hydrolase or acyltransferase protein [Massilia sp. LC238]